jgi:hypothetical protein
VVKNTRKFLKPNQLQLPLPSFSNKFKKEDSKCKKREKMNKKRKSKIKKENK